MAQPQKAAPNDAQAPDFFRTLIESVPEAVIVSTPEGEITYFNARCEELLGYTAGEVVGRNITMLVPQQPGRRADPMKWLARWSAEPPHMQSRFLDLIGQTKDGRQMPVDVRVVEGRVGVEPRYFITVRDNTARRQEQISFKEAHLRASRILAIAEDGIVSVDGDQKISFFNLKAEKIFGYAAEDVLGKPLETLIPERFHGRHHIEVNAFGAGKVASQMMTERGEVVGRRKNGEEFPVEATITKVSVGGVPTYTAHIRDVTDRKKAALRLAESERRFRAIFDHAFSAVGLLAPDGTVLEINKAARELTEGSTELKGLPLWDLPWIGDEGPGEDIAPDEQARQRLKTAVADAAAGETVRYTATLTQGGRERQIDLSLVPIKDDDGKVIYIVPEGRDVTDVTGDT